MAKYGDGSSTTWPDRVSELRADLDLYMAQMLTLGALNWAVEWWDPRRSSLDTVVANAQSFVRFGLAEPTAG